MKTSVWEDTEAAVRRVPKQGQANQARKNSASPPTAFHACRAHGARVETGSSLRESDEVACMVVALAGRLPSMAAVLLQLMRVPGQKMTTSEEEHPQLSRLEDVQWFCACLCA